MASNVNATVTELNPIGGATNSGYKVGFLDSATKTAQNDTITITNASAVIWVDISVDSTGASETNTVATNVITCTSAATSATMSGLVLYR